jgi:hypothetical protein
MNNFFTDIYDDTDFTLFLQSINSSRERIKRIYNNNNNEHIAQYVRELYDKFKQTISALEHKDKIKEKLMTEIAILCKNDRMKESLVGELNKFEDNATFIEKCVNVNKQTGGDSNDSGSNSKETLKKLQDANKIFAGESVEGGMTIDELKYLQYNNEISTFKYTMEDKYIFIGVTFVIRAISLVILKWAIDVDFVTIFESAIYLYIAIYILLFCMIWAIINYSGMETDNLPYYLYSFNRINGNTHLIVHIALMLILSIIPFIIQAGKDDLSFSKHFSESMEGKRDIYRGISNFTLLSWISLSLIALI